MALIIRAARFSDVPALVALVERRRDDYRVVAPLFWKKASRSAVWTARFYRFLLFTRRATMLVATEDGALIGFLIASRARVPPVFDPGPTVFVDDFYVTSPDRWADAGEALVARLREIAMTRGWRQLIAVSGTVDTAKNSFLAASGLTETSSWWTGPL